MEAERILTDAMPCTVHIAMPHDYAARLEASRFDLMLIDVGTVVKNGSKLVERQMQKGTSVIFTTLTDDAMEDLPEFRGFASVAKPFVDDELLLAVAAMPRLPDPEL